MAKLQKDITPEQALARLQRSCSLRETCSQAALQKLALWKISPEDSAKIMQALTSEKWIDDKRYAEAFTREKSRISKWGSTKIRTYLQSKNISNEFILNALQQIKVESEKDALEQLLTKKIKSVKAKSPQDLFAKLVRFGISRGYKYEEVVRFVKNMVKEGD